MDQGVSRRNQGWSTERCNEYGVFVNDIECFAVEMKYGSFEEFDEVDGHGKWEKSDRKMPAQGESLGRGKAAALLTLAATAGRIEREFFLWKLNEGIPFIHEFAADVAECCEVMIEPGGIVVSEQVDAVTGPATGNRRKRTVDPVECVSGRVGAFNFVRFEPSSEPMKSSPETPAILQIRRPAIGLLVAGGCGPAESGMSAEDADVSLPEQVVRCLRRAPSRGVRVTCPCPCVALLTSEVP